MTWLSHHQPLWKDIFLTWGLKWKNSSEDFSKTQSQLIITTCLLQAMADGLGKDSPHLSLWTQDLKWTLRMMRGSWLRISDGAWSENLLDGTPEAAEHKKHLCRKQAKVRALTGAWISQVVQWEDVKNCQTLQIIGVEYWERLWEYRAVRQTALR